MSIENVTGRGVEEELLRVLNVSPSEDLLRAACVIAKVYPDLPAAEGVVEGVRLATSAAESDHEDAVVAIIYLLGLKAVMQHTIDAGLVVTGQPYFLKGDKTEFEALCAGLLKEDLSPRYLDLDHVMPAYTHYLGCNLASYYDCEASDVISWLNVDGRIIYELFDLHMLARFSDEKLALYLSARRSASALCFDKAARILSKGDPEFEANLFADMEEIRQWLFSAPYCFKAI